MVLRESGEMYPETINVLRKEKGFVRATDIGAQLGYSKPSVSRAMGMLRDGGYIKVAQDGGITLMEAGLEVAERTYERHTVLSELFMKRGVDEENVCFSFFQNKRLTKIKRYDILHLFGQRWVTEIESSIRDMDVCFLNGSQPLLTV